MKKVKLKNNLIRKKNGIVLVSTMMMLAMLLTLMATYFVITKTELGTARYSGDSLNGFYTAEAGLNLRADQIRQSFLSFTIPAGTAPNATNACQNTNLGSGAFACQTYTFDQHKTITYIEPNAGNPITVTIPNGDRFQGLTAQEYRYTAKAIAKNVASDKTESMVDLVFKVRTVPIFQFAAFYNKDIEITPGAAMTFIGPIHTNGDMYLNSQDSSATKLQLDGQLTVAGKLCRGRKDTNTCNTSSVKVKNPTTYTQLGSACSGSGRLRMYPADVTSFNNMIQIGIPAVGVPPVSSTEPVAGKAFWDRADLRLMLKLTSTEAIDTSVSATGIYVADSNGSVNTAHTTSLHTCTSALAGFSKPVRNISFWNFRENKQILVLDTDMLALFNCLKSTNWFGTGKLLSETSDGGIILYLGVNGPNSNGINRYAVRVRNGAELKSTVAGAPAIKGLTVVTNQAMYSLGNFNITNKKPAALIGDSYNTLSNQWTDLGSSAVTTFSSRNPTAGVTVNAAIVANTSTTGGVEGVGGQGGAYGGGIHNFPRLHENWNGKSVTLVGSMVSLGQPLHVNGPWAENSPYYTIPARAFSYDTSFNSPANLPPMTMQFVYLKEELFLRDFEQ